MEGTNIDFELKLLIDTKSNRVLFAEASKDVVDFIFSFLTLPLGAVTKLLSKDGMVGSIGEIYRSLSELNDNYIVSGTKVSSLLNPSIASSCTQNTHFYLPPAPPYQCREDRKFYFCYNSTNSDIHGTCCAYVSDMKDVICPCCRNKMNHEIKFMRPKPRFVVPVGSEGSGYVMGGVLTYSVMDDLTTVPMSAMSGITLLNKLEIKDLGSLEEKTVTVGYKEGLKLLRASLQSKTVLTDVFLKSN